MTRCQVNNCDQLFYLATRYFLKVALVATEKKSLKKDKYSITLIKIMRFWGTGNSLDYLQILLGL